MQIITGFHAIEEKLRSFADTGKGIPKAPEGVQLHFSRPGPRVKKILAQAKELAIPATETTAEKLDTMVLSKSPLARDHRGLVLVLENAENEEAPRFDLCLSELAGKDNALVILLDSITDPQNTGAIIRSADQFAVDLVVLPEHRSATDFETIGRTSAGASSWVKITLVPNLVRAVEQLKEAGFWIYGADSGGEPVQTIAFTGKKALILGSEGKGIARLLHEKCDKIVSIPTSGRLDSLNVSVAAGVLLYEIRRQDPKPN